MHKYVLSRLFCLIVPCIFLSAMYASNAQQKVPLWEYDTHFLEYQLRCLEGSIHRIDNLFKDLKENPHNEIEIIHKIEIELEICQSII